MKMTNINVNETVYKVAQMNYNIPNTCQWKFSLGMTYIELKQNTNIRVNCMATLSQR